MSNDDEFDVPPMTPREATAWAVARGAVYLTSLAIVAGVSGYAWARWGCFFV